MLKRVVLFGAGGVLAALGLVGLVLPFMPGVIFLVLAALCFSAASPLARARLEAHPGWRRWQRRWRMRGGLSPFQRTKLAFWLTADAALRETRRR